MRVHSIVRNPLDATKTLFIPIHGEPQLSFLQVAAVSSYGFVQLATSFKENSVLEFVPQTAIWSLDLPCNFSCLPFQLRGRP